MGGLVKSGKKTLPIRQTALSLIRDLDQKDFAGEVKLIHAFVRDSIRYARDVAGVETLHTPEKTLEFGQGDCDDKSSLVSALLESIGHPTRFVAIGFQPNEYVHVYAETKIGKRWVSVETTEPVAIGWEPRGVVSRLIYFN